MTAPEPSSPSFPFEPAAAVAHLRRADRVLARLIDAVGEYGLQPRGDPFTSLAQAILYQQLAGAAAAAIERRFTSLFGDGRYPAPAELLATREEELRAAGLSRQKLAYLRDLAARFLDETLDPQLLPALEDEEVVRQVAAVKGIGRWTAQMYLMFSLGRPDVLPVGDLGLRRAVREAYGLAELPSPEELTRLAEPWRPYRSVATWYLWQSTRVVLMDPSP